MSPWHTDDATVRRPETKSFILTSEFWVAAGAAAAVFLAGYALDDIAKTTAWRYGVWIAIAYVLSRGIAKAGSQRAYQPDPASMSSRAWREDRSGYDDDRYRDDDRYQDDAPRRRDPVTTQADEPTQRYDVPEEERDQNR